MQLASKNGGVIHIGGTDGDSATLTVETGAVTIRGHQRKSAAEALTACGQDRRTALRLTCDINHVASAEANTGVLLPAAKAGASVVVINGSNSSIVVYAGGLDDIDAVRGATGRPMRAAECVEYVCVRNHDWVAVELGSVARRKLKWRSMSDRAVETIGRFDRDYYLKNNQDVLVAGVDPERHYLEHGWKEGRDPSPYFNVRGYLEANPDVAAAQVEPLGHFVRHGLGEGREGWRKPYDETADAPGNGRTPDRREQSLFASVINRLTGRR